MTHPTKLVVTAMDHEGRHADCGENGSKIGLRGSPHRPRRRRARPPMASSAPPGAETRVGDHARSHKGQVVPSSSSWFDDRFFEALQDESRHSERVVIASGETGEAVHQHQGADALRMRRRQQHGSEPAESDAENGRLPYPFYVHHCQGITCPLLDRRWIRRAQRVRQPDTPQIKPNQP